MPQILKGVPNALRPVAGKTQSVKTKGSYFRGFQPVAYAKGNEGQFSRQSPLPQKLAARFFKSQTGKGVKVGRYQTVENNLTSPLLQ